MGTEGREIWSLDGIIELIFLIEGIRRDFKAGSHQLSQQQHLNLKSR
jgi:hypothetical protein